MFSYIRGKVVNKMSDSFILDNNGIGYKIFSPLSTLNKLQVGKDETIYTYLQVREDYLGLFGFLSLEEMHTFELLLSVSGVGPKVANSILSTLEPSRISLAIVTSDSTCLKGIPGIGLKTAQRIILELKDKIKKENLISDESIECANNIEYDNSCVEATKVLQVLGYSTQDARQMLKGIDFTNKSTEDIVKEALKNYAK